jgi:predicted MFS family arabinose efflux permease
VAIALTPPFVDQIWQIFVLQSASAAFTPTFQAALPDILPDERDYTRALSLSRLAYDLENLSPTLAALLLTVVPYNALFGGTVIGFLCSAALMRSVTLPMAMRDERTGGIYDRTTRGLRIYLATPRLRGLLALNLAVAAAGAMVIVNTVVIVQGLLSRPQTDVALALGLFGGGSMIAALTLPRVLDRLSDRAVMIPAAALLGGVLLSVAVMTRGGTIGWPLLLETWLVLGIAYSALQTPTGRLLRRSAIPEDRPAAFAAQFSLSHAAWLVTYPLAGWLGASLGMPVTLAILGGPDAGGRRRGCLALAGVRPGRDRARPCRPRSFAPASVRGPAPRPRIRHRRPAPSMAGTGRMSPDALRTSRHRSPSRSVLADLQPPGIAPKEYDLFDDRASLPVGR